MSSLTRCTHAGRAPRPLPLSALLKVLVVFSAALVFGAAHLALRFKLDVIEAETNQLQSLAGTLTSEVKALQGKNEALKQPDHLYQYASAELGMVPYRASERSVLRLNQAVYARYASPEATSQWMARAGGEAAPAAAAKDNSFFERLSERLGLLGQAQAAETTQHGR
jgi:hypothetical protein